MKKILVSIFSCAFLLLGIGLSYAYFTGMIFGEGKKVSIVSKNLRILFTDSEELADADIKPGWSQTKTFSVKNESDDTFNYNIIFENLVNTFVTEGFLQYKITSSNGYNMEGYLDIPKSNTPTDVVLAYDIDIPVDTTHEYTIEFVYHNSDTVDQSEDMGKELSGNLAITEGTVNPDIKYTVTMNSDNGVITPTSNQVVKKGNLEFEVTPNTGYDINSMSVSCTPVANTVITNNIIRVNDIREDHNCEVSFDKETYTVNIVVNNGESDALNKVVEYGGSGAAKITPKKGYTLSGAIAEGPCTIEGEVLSISHVVSDGTCTVTLSRDKYTVTLTGTGIASSDSPQEAEYEGSTTIEFTLSEGYELGSNVINCDNGEPSISGNVLTVNNVQDNTICTLSPTLKSYDVTLVVNGGTPTSETKTIEHNGSKTYTITNNTGYKLELNGNISCTGNASGSLSGSMITISNVTTTQICTVNLKKETYSVSVSVNSSTMGSVSPSSTTVNHGDNLTIIITPKSGYVYKSNTCGLTVTNNKMTFTNITSVKSCKVTFEAEKPSGTLAEWVKKKYPPVSGRTDFSVIDNGTPKLYTGTDDQGTTYYFSGDGSSMNNWVSFAGSLWRVIRINGNGSVRLLYAGDGNKGSSSNKYNGVESSSYNSTRNHPQYVGWKYTVGDSLSANRRNETASTIYGVVETWYNGLSTANKGYIDTETIYCNDRNLRSGDTYSISSKFDYAAFERLAINKAPMFTCSDTSDRFTTFGLMTADEVAYAGGVYGTNSPKAYYYLAKDGSSSIIGDQYWWTMSPSYWNITNKAVVVFGVGGSRSPGGFVDSYVLGSQVVRPVVSLKSSVQVTGGSGTGNNPYTVSYTPTLADNIKTAYPPQEGRTDFSAIDNGTAKLYKGADDQGTTYYFSGNGLSMKNWVSFAGSMWRIIRINGNGSVRLLYAGDGTDATDIGSSAFNGTKNDPMYVGWKYGTTGNLTNNRTNGNKSTIYGVVETWYNGLGSTNQNYIDTGAIYCNDRNLASGSIYSTSSSFYYAVRGRLDINKAPIFTCSNTSDRFTTFGLMTADEVAYAGGVFGSDSPKAYYYLAKNGSSITGSSWWWTMSPSNYSSSRNSVAFFVFGSGNPGRLNGDFVGSSLVVRPVISIKSNTLVSGTGTANDPYVVQGLQ